MIKDAVTYSCRQVLGSKKYTRKEWITTETLEKIDGRKNRKAALNNSRTRSDKIGVQAAYTEANKMVKMNITADKKAYLDCLAVEAEEAAHHGNMRAVYANTRKLSGISNKLERPIKGKK